MKHDWLLLFASFEDCARDRLRVETVTLIVIVNEETISDTRAKHAALTANNATSDELPLPFTDGQAPSWLSAGLDS